MVRIRRFHRRGRGSIPRLGNVFCIKMNSYYFSLFIHIHTDACNITGLDNVKFIMNLLCVVIGLYREIAIAIQKESGDSNGGNV